MNNTIEFNWVFDTLGEIEKCTEKYIYFKENGENIINNTEHDSGFGTILVLTLDRFYYYT